MDFLDAVAFHIGPVLRWFYQFQLRMAPWSYELSYKLAPVLRAPAVMVDTWLTRRKLRRIIKEFRPDTIVSVYPLASLVLGRMQRHVVLLDTDAAANAVSDAMHGFLSRDGTPPADVRRAGREQR